MKQHKKWDVFICHASEDKEEIADPLANKLTSLGIKVWYDRFRLRWGNRLMKEIDHGLVNSKYGIVILSPSFFDKHWPESELQALFSLMGSERHEDLLLPLLHNIKFEDIKVRYPLISGILCRSSDMALDVLAAEVAELVSKMTSRKKESPGVANKISNVLLNPNTTCPTVTSIELEQLDGAKATTLHRQFISPVTKETREAAYSELYSLCNKKKVWKQELIWKILNYLLLNSKSDVNDLRDGLAILEHILRSASRTSDMNEVTNKIQEAYQSRFKEILLNVSPGFQTHRSMAVAILKWTSNFQELFNTCWQSWINGLQEIQPEYCYSEYIKPLLQIFDQAESYLFDAVRDEILKYLEGSNEMIRKRALDIYKLYFV